MSPEAQRIAIAKACGWVPELWSEGRYTRWFKDGKYAYQPNHDDRELPDYCADLNAMHEAESLLPDLASDDDFADQLGFCETLAEVLGAKWGSD